MRTAAAILCFPPHLRLYLRMAGRFHPLIEASSRIRHARRDRASPAGLGFSSLPTRPTPPSCSKTKWSGNASPAEQFYGITPNNFRKGAFLQDQIPERLTLIIYPQNVFCFFFWKNTGKTQHALNRFRIPHFTLYMNNSILFFGEKCRFYGEFTTRGFRVC